MQVLDYLHAVNHIEGIVFKGPSSIEVDVVSIDTSGTSLFREDRCRFDSAKELWLVVQVTEKKFPVGATYIQKGIRAYLLQTFPTPISTTLSAALMTFVNDILYKFFHSVSPSTLGQNLRFPQHRRSCAVFEGIEPKENA